MKNSHSDADIIRAFRKGDDAAFEELVRRYQRQVANVVYLTIGNREDVQDLTQDVFLRAYKSLNRFDENSSLYSWLYRIAVNLCIDEIRRRKVRKVLSLEVFGESGHEKQIEFKQDGESSDRVLGRERRDVVEQALKKLSPAHRSVLVLREYDDMSYAEIAKTTRVSVQAVKSRIFRARQELKELLKDYFEEQT